MTSTPRKYASPHQNTTSMQAKSPIRLYDVLYRTDMTATPEHKKPFNFYRKRSGELHTERSFSWMSSNDDKLVPVVDYSSPGTKEIFKKLRARRLATPALSKRR